MISWCSVDCGLWLCVVWWGGESPSSWLDDYLVKPFYVVKFLRFPSAVVMGPSSHSFYNYRQFKRNCFDSVSCRLTAKRYYQAWIHRRLDLGLNLFECLSVFFCLKGVLLRNKQRESEKFSLKAWNSFHKKMEIVREITKIWAWSYASLTRQYYSR